MLLGQMLLAMSHETSHWQELPQSMLSQAPSMPVQVAWHLPVPQPSCPHALLPPVHVSVQAPPLQVIEPQASAPSQVRVHAPVVQIWLPHTALPLPPLQVDVQSPPPLHVIVEHAFAPVQVAVQSPDVQVIASHA
jgi:hypothetical protein